MILRRAAGVFLPVLFFAGCAVVPSPQPPPQPQPPQPQGEAPAPSATLPKTDGKYYLDDGPPTAAEQATAAAAKDAVVRWEPLMSSRNRPYVALGNRYQPYRHLSPYRREGVASWYGRRYHGRPTASGEKYDMFKMTAAHPLLPIPSYVRVTRAATGESVVVRVNDRGPFLGGRLIDLSYAAAQRLGFVNAGTAEVVVELLIPPDAPADAVSADAPAAKTPVAVDGGVYIQLAAFESRAAAAEFLEKLRQVAPAAFADKAEIYAQEEIFRVQVGPYPTREAAAAEDRILCGEYRQCGFLTHR